MWLVAPVWSVQEGDILSTVGWCGSTPALPHTTCAEARVTFSFQFSFQSVPYGYFCKIQEKQITEGCELW